MNKTFTLSIITLLALTLFVFSQSFVTPTTPSLYISIIGGIIGGILLITGRIKKPTISGTKSEGIFISFLTLFMIINAFENTIDPENILSGISLLLLYGMIRRIELYRSWLLVGFSLLGITEAGYGIGQYLHWFTNWNDNFPICGSFDNPAGFAASLVMLFPFTLQLSKERQYFRKAIGILGFIMTVSAIVLSQSRAGIIALTLIAGIGFYQLHGGIKLRWWSKRLKFATGGVILFALVVGLYFLKKDSANGRLLIWQCSACMIADKPLLGHEAGGFQREYMLYQADFFRDHPDSSFTMLADIVKHPFNEFLLLLVEYGLIGGLFFGAFIYLLIREYRKNPDEEKRYAGLCLIGIALFACFSYPMNYPFVRMMAVLSAAIIMRNEERRWTISRPISTIIKPLAITLCLGLITLTGKLCYDEYQWCDIAHRSLAGETRAVMPDYARLYKTMNHNALFLYNYSAELNYIGEWQQSNKLLQKCACFYNDIDLQLLLADNYTQLKQYRQAEQSLLLAHQMIPNRFIPLYRLANLYKDTGRKTKAHLLAQAIIKKRVKVISPEVMSIKAEMKEMEIKKK